MYHTYGGKSTASTSAYNFGVLASGRQVGGPGTPFVPTHSGALDWSCFSPSNRTANGLDVARSHGVTQFGCCAKTGEGPAIEGEAGRRRRILFGWQQNGNSGGDHLGTDPRAWANGSENTMTLPRELRSVTRAAFAH